MMAAIVVGDLFAFPDHPLCHQDHLATLTEPETVENLGLPTLAHRVICRYTMWPTDLTSQVSSLLHWQ
jgi:hypothetical protein